MFIFFCREIYFKRGKIGREGSPSWAVGELRFKSCTRLPGERELPAVLSRIPNRRVGQKGRRVVRCESPEMC